MVHAVSLALLREHTTPSIRGGRVPAAVIEPLRSIPAPPRLLCGTPRAARGILHDHVRLEHMLFDGALFPVNGEMEPDLGRPGLGLELKEADAQRFAV